MWDEKWGEMIWGGTPAVPVQIPFGPWALIFLGFILGICAVYANRSRMARVVPFLMVLLVPIVSVVAVNLPYVFQNGTVADANQVNENFSTMASAIDAQSSVLEATAFGNPTRGIVTALDHTKLTDLCDDNSRCLGRICLIGIESDISNEDSCRPFELRYRSSDSQWYVRRESSGVHGFDGDSIIRTGVTLGPCGLTDADSWSLTGGFLDSRPGLSVSNTSSFVTNACTVVIKD